MTHGTSPTPQQPSPTQTSALPSWVSEELARRAMLANAPHPAASEPWPEGVIARYLTIGGATVDLKQDGTSRAYVDATDCTGCGWHDGYTIIKAARYEAQKHAERCRALPKPQAQ